MQKNNRPPLEHWRYFVCCVEMGSFQKVAETFQTDASYVSKSVKDLEIFVGEALLKRNRPQLTLTWVGREYYEKIKPLLDQSNSLFKSKKAASLNKFRIAVPATLSKLFIRWISEFEAQNSSVIPEVDFYDKKVKPVLGDFDYIVTLGTLPNARVYATALGLVQRIMVTASPNKERLLLITEPEMLNDYSLVSEKNSLVVQTQNLSMTLKMKLAFQVNDIVTVVDSVLLENAIAIGMPRWAVSEALNNGSLYQVLPEWSCSPETVWLLRNEKAKKNSEVEKFITYLQTSWVNTPGLLLSYDVRKNAQ